MFNFFGSIPTRPESGLFEASWVNSLKVQGVALENFLAGLLGTGALPESIFDIPNNQSSPTNITGLVHDSALVRTAFVEYTARRKATSRVTESGIIVVQYTGLAWEMDWMRLVGNANINFTHDSATSQIKIDTDNMAGSYDTDFSKLIFRSKPFAT